MTSGSNKYRASRLGTRISLLCIALLSGTFISAAWAQDLAPRDTGDLVSTIQAVKPGVVAVGTYYFRDTPKARFYGTGFVVGDGRRVVTNYHVLDQVREKEAIGQLRVFHPQLSSSGVEAFTIKEDKTHDLALIGIKGEPLVPLRLGDSKGVHEGEEVAFTGYPIGLVLGLNSTTHAGIISAIAPIIVPSPTARVIDRELIPFLRHPFDVFQLDATAYPGNSGSPLYRRRTGEVIGVINQVFVKGKKEHILKEPTGITYAIPIEHVKALMK